ncbi:hypothetical protein BOX37_27865 [Nocardia mangyaensis]|jgi:hypothetical protein|uniref:Uncharacterized protein n=1 Tax=Nocardia mangyaensis TaxID=2213200 RepID=A0A1J0VYU4_9NOCA|nr:hypothetical protein [Nocardia mangyaensis]APE37111.1 hypothetical protein BOX37_27865 [Nocardia mangyaensis]
MPTATTEIPSPTDPATTTAPDVVDSIERAEFVRREHLGTAGPISTLPDEGTITRWRADHPRWRGRHWTYIGDSDGVVLRLRPVNVARAARRRTA